MSDPHFLSDPNEEISNSLAAEKAIIATAIQDPRCILDIRQYLGANDFFDRRHIVIWGAIEFLDDIDHPITLQNISNELEKSGHAYEMGGDAYLIYLASMDLPSYSTVINHVKKLKKLSDQRNALREKAKPKKTTTPDTSKSNVTFTSTDTVGRQHLDVKSLEFTVLPYIKAISGVQEVINQAAHKDPAEILIYEISQHSPLTISLSGVMEGISSITEIIVPWRRKHARRMADLIETEKRLQLDQMRLEQFAKKAEISKSNVEEEKLRAETGKLQAEMVQIQLDNEKRHLDLKQTRMQLGLDMLAKIAPYLDETERDEYLNRLLPYLDVLMESELEVASVQTVKPEMRLE